jgi:YHS domain-containing protein
MAQKSERDVVCGMMVDPKNSAAIVNYKNRIYYFCHSSCAKKFEIDPEIYLNNNPVFIPAPWTLILLKTTLETAQNVVCPWNQSVVQLQQIHPIKHY